MSKNAPTLAKRAQTARRRHELSQLISQGVRRHADLAERLGVSERTIERDLAELEKIYTEQGAEQIVEIQNRERIITWRGIEDAIAALQPLVDNPRTRIQALRLRKELWERKSKLLGLDMPSKHAHTDPTGQREYKGLDPELRRKILERSRTNGDAPTVDHTPLQN